MKEKRDQKQHKLDVNDPMVSNGSCTHVLLMVLMIKICHLLNEVENVNPCFLQLEVAKLQNGQIV